MNSQPLVSVIIATKDEEKNIKNLLESLQRQSYKNIEVIVVDNNSTDKTKEIAGAYTDKVFNWGPERSSQRNFGIENSSGDFILILDADMVLEEKVVEECVEVISSDEGIAGVIIPEISFGEGFWAKCKALEKSFYFGVNYIEAARFYRKSVLKEAAGFDVELISGEDWDLSFRVAEKYKSKTGRIQSFIYHNEGRLTLLKTMKKKFYYGKTIGKYLRKNRLLKVALKQTNVFGRFELFFRQPLKLFKNPLLGLGMLFMKFCEFGAGAVGYLISKVKSNKYV